MQVFATRFDLLVSIGLPLVMALVEVEISLDFLQSIFSGYPITLRAFQTSWTFVLHWFGWHSACWCFWEVQWWGFCLLLIYYWGNGPSYFGLCNKQWYHCREWQNISLALYIISNIFLYCGIYISTPPPFSFPLLKYVLGLTNLEVDSVKSQRQPRKVQWSMSTAFFMTHCRKLANILEYW